MSRQLLADIDGVAELFASLPTPGRDDFRPLSLALPGLCLASRQASFHGVDDLGQENRGDQISLRRGWEGLCQELEGCGVNSGLVRPTLTREGA